MKAFKPGDRAYHLREGDPYSHQGFGTILEIRLTKAKLVWEESQKEDIVDVRDLLTEQIAKAEGLE